MLGYPHGGNISFSLGIIKNIDEKDDYTIEYLCKTNPGFSGCSIINLKNNLLEFIWEHQKLLIKISI